MNICNLLREGKKKVSVSVLINFNFNLSLMFFFSFFFSYKVHVKMYHFDGFRRPFSAEQYKCVIVTIDSYDLFYC